MNTTGSWHAEHRHFEHFLDYLELQLGVLRDGGSPNYALIRNVLDYLNHFGARYHHTREHIAFECIVRNSPAITRTIDRLRREHDVITSRGDEVGTLLARPNAGSTIARREVESALISYLSAYRAHIAAEEQDVLPLAEQMLSAADWAGIDGAAPRGPDPFQMHSSRRHNPTFGSEAETRYRELYEQIRRSRSTQPIWTALPRVDGHHEGNSRPERRMSGFLAASRSENQGSRTVTASRALPRQAFMLLALVLAYLEYYLIDIYLQIERLPSLTVYLFR